MTRSQFRFLFGILLAVVPVGLSRAQVGTAVPNWTVPPYGARSGSSGLSTMTDISNGISFVAVTPCRVFDTRDPVGPYGGPRLIANTTRNFDVDSGSCGPIPSAVEAYSMNFGAIQADGNGFITIWPAGGAQPLSSAINTLAGQVISNAAIVPSGTAGAISVFPNTGVHLYGDINGYFTDVHNPNNFFVQVGNRPGGSVGLFVNDSAAAFSSAVSGFVGPVFSNLACCGPTGVIGQGAFNGVAGVAQDRGTVGVLVNGAGAGIAEGQLGKSGASATQAYGVTGTTQPPANADDTAGVLGNALASSGRTYGVRGFTASAHGGAAGVIGFSADAAFAGVASGGYAGVIGIAGPGEGVKGITSNASGEGTAGYMVNGAGTILASGFLGYTSSTGVFFQNGLAGSGTKSFVEPHPTDASKVIKFISLEGNEPGTYFRGRGRFQNGLATISVPEEFRMVTDPDGLSVQVTPIGQMASVAVESIGLERIVVRGSRNVEFFYLVHGIRRAYKGAAIVAENEKFFVPDSPDARIPLYLSADERRRLVDNGTYRADGTVNTETARRLGWDRAWEKRSGPQPQPEPPTTP